MELGGSVSQDYDVSACACKPAHALVWYVLCLCWSVHWSVSLQQNQKPTNLGKLGQIGKVEISMELWGYAWYDYDVCACSGKHTHMLACMYIIFQCASAYMTAKLGQIIEIKVSMESGEHARAVWTHCMTWAYKLAYMHTIFFHAQAHMHAKLGRIREIRVSMEWGKHAGPLWAHKVTSVHTLV